LPFFRIRSLHLGQVPMSFSSNGLLTGCDASSIIHEREEP
jgi:hypothetical protein